ncbi:MAG: molybdate ABC transporter substrate-binding protein [Mesorhizobium amorphae]|nr:MAG: molybdate ABC transporter substrate-binding protein [Mesorhizobium amorphae]
MPARRSIKWGAALGGVMMLAGMGAASAQESVTVFAAASLKNALDAINTQCEASVGEKATISYAASSALAKQIESGAPADIFMSADRDWMKYLADKDLVRKDTETELLGNSIVLVAPADSTASATIAPGFDLAGLLGDGKLAMGNVDSVPAGKYGKASLESLGIWDSVSGSVAQTENVRAALALVSTGEAPLGIVYKTDAAADPKVKIVGTFPAESHPEIVYPIAQTTESKDAEAPAFLACLKTPEAAKLFEEQGFTVLAGPSN